MLWIRCPGRYGHARVAAAAPPARSAVVGRPVPLRPVPPVRSDPEPWWLLWSSTTTVGVASSVTSTATTPEGLNMATYTVPPATVAAIGSRGVLPLAVSGTDRRTAAAPTRLGSNTSSASPVTNPIIGGSAAALVLFPWWGRRTAQATPPATLHVLVGPRRAAVARS